MTWTVTTVVAAGWVAGWLLAGRGRSLTRLAPDPSTAQARPLAVSVVVPARDEQDRLPRLLAALAASAPPPAEVLVVDDGSTDRTADLARAAGARVLTVDPPPGWTGKAWACQQGADAATGDLLVFLDADTEPAPAAVAQLADAATSGELVSVQPRHRVERAYEHLSAGPALVALLAAGTGPVGPRRWWRRPMAFGPAVAVRADAYHRFGGHGAARAEVADDLALARAADRAGVGVRAVTGDDLIGYRMYPGGPAQLVEGWSKNLATGAGATPPARLGATVLWVTASLQVALLLALSPGLVTGSIYGLFALQHLVLQRRIGRFGIITAAAFPLPMAAFVALFARSVLLTTARGTVPWRGRQIPARARDRS